MFGSQADRLAHQTLERAAETIGDVTQPAMDLFFERFPEGRSLFTAHASATVGNLEGQMVESVVFYILQWIEQPGEVRMALGQSAWHHFGSLGVEPAHFEGLIDSVHEVIGNTIPLAEKDELDAWMSISASLKDICAAAWSL